jgi:hypothetical protein
MYLPNYVIIRSPIEVNLRNFMFAYQKMYGKFPHFNHMCMFGSIIYVQMLHEFHTNQDKKIWKCILVGLFFKIQMYWCYQLEIHKILLIGGVKFDEHKLWCPFNTLGLEIVFEQPFHYFISIRLFDLLLIVMCHSIDHVLLGMI